VGDPNATRNRAFRRPRNPWRAASPNAGKLVWGQALEQQCETQ
jgi:hypothetical protein